MGVVILTGESCSGKDTIRRALEKKGYKNIVSYTTRPIRCGEINGVDYNFVGGEEFKRMIYYNEMLEYRTYNTLLNGIQNKWYYGLRKENLDTNKDYVVVLDLGGAEKFYDYYEYDKCKCHVIKINAPYEIRINRAEKRGSFDSIEWNRRHKADDIDFSFDKLFEFEKHRKLWRIDNSKQGSMAINRIADIIDCINKEIVR